MWMWMCMRVNVLLILLLLLFSLPLFPFPVFFLTAVEVRKASPHSGIPLMICQSAAPKGEKNEKAIKIFLS